MAPNKFMGVYIYILISCIAILPSLVSASDVLVWQGQYYTGTTFNTGTYEFNFTVYDALTGGNICYSNKTTLTTGNFGEWKTEQNGVNFACNNASKDYFLNINMGGVDQTPRKRVLIWNFLRKNVNETTSGKLQADAQVIAPIIQADAQIVAPLVNVTQVTATNITTTNYGFFSYLGILANRITKLFVQDIDASGNVNSSGNVTASYFIGEGSLLTGISSGGGNPFNQICNTTSNVTFNIVTVDNIQSKGDTIGITADSINLNGNFIGINGPSEQVGEAHIFSAYENAFSVINNLNNKQTFSVDTINGMVTIDGLIKLETIILPSCNSTTNGNIGRNATKLYFCDGIIWNELY